MAGIARSFARVTAVTALFAFLGCHGRQNAGAPLPAFQREGAARESAGIALVKIDFERHALVVDEDDNAITEVVLGRDEKGPMTKVVGTTRLPSRPHDLLVLADGRVAVSLPDAGAVALLARQANGTLQETARLATPAEPLAMALSPDDGTLWVTGGASHTLTAFNLVTKTERARHTLGREPRGLLVTEKGDRVFVAHAAESFLTVVSVLGGPITTQDLGAGQCASPDQDSCPQRRYARNAQRVVRTRGGAALVPMALSLPAPPGVARKQFRVSKADFQLSKPGGEAMFQADSGGGYGGDGSFGPSIAPVMAMVGPDGDAWFDFAFEVGCKAPAGAAAWSGGAPTRDVLVACPGRGKIFRYGWTKGQMEKLTAADPSARPREADLVPIFPIDVPDGPSALVTTSNGEAAFVWSAFERTVSLVNVAAEEPEVVSSIRLPRTVPRAAAWLRGREIFASESMPEISFDGRACTSCHVDGRDDGLVWRTPRGLRHTRLLAGQLRVGPFGWSGDAPTFEAHVRGTIHNLRGTGLGDEDMNALKTYATAMAAPPAATANEDVAHGKALYRTAECASCHDGERTIHDVGTGATLLTPTLAGVGSRRRLMHDGRFTNLEELVASSTQMGGGSKLSAPDRRALVRYLETL